MAWCEYVRTQAPPGPLLVVGKTKDSLQRNVLDALGAYFGGASPLRHTPGANSGTLFGRKVHMVGANDLKAETRIRGRTLAGSYVDEAALLLGQTFWSMLITRHITTFGLGAKIFATTNPDSPSHWFKTEVLDRPDKVRGISWSSGSTTTGSPRGREAGPPRVADRVVLQAVHRRAGGRGRGRRVRHARPREEAPHHLG